MISDAVVGKPAPPVTDRFIASFQGQRAEWRVRAPVPAEIVEAASARVPGLSRMLTHLLYTRGYSTPSEIAAFFLHPFSEHDPYRLPDMREAEERIRRAIETGERIALCGDFDCDGLTATAVLASALRMLEHDPIVVIPGRAHGHGLQHDQLAALARDGVTLVITVDCGISAIEEVDLARRLGLDVIVTDHHAPAADGALPACPVVSASRLDSGYPFRYLSGVGVAYKLAQVLLAGDERSRDLLDLVALGTMADVVPLRDENRSLVIQGLMRLRETRRPGLRALATAAGLQLRQLTPEAVTFQLAPRINVANRLGDPRDAYELLVTEDVVRAGTIAAALDARNRERQTLVSRNLETLARTMDEPAAVMHAIQVGQRPPLLVVVGDWPAGISGLLAAKLVGIYGVPVAAGAVGADGTIAASIRGRGDVDIVGLVQACARRRDDLFLRYGGHAGAAGFAIKADGLAAVTALLEDEAARVVSITNTGSVLDVDAIVRLEQVDLQAATQIARLNPFGADFPEPVFLARQVRLVGRRSMGKDGRHLQARARSNGSSIRAVMFAYDPALRLQRESEPLDVVFTLKRGEWQGETYPEIHIRDWRPSGTALPTP